MLKLRKNISLKKLKKYGFEVKKSEYFPDHIYIHRCNTNVQRIIVHKDLHLSFNTICKNTLDTLCTLARDKIIERVDE